MLKAMGMEGDKQQKMSESEVLTVAWIAHAYFSGNYSKTLQFLKVSGQTLFKNVLSKSRFLRRLHRWREYLFPLFQALAQIKREISRCQTYIIDSFPIKACENIRIARCKIFQGEEYRGYIPSKKAYFYGIRLHLICDEESFVHEFVILQGKYHDLDGLAHMSMEYMSKEDQLVADKGYKSYTFEDQLKDEGINFRPLRDKKSSRYEGEEIEFEKAHKRKRIETLGSVLRDTFLGHRVKTVSAEGFILKVMMGVLSCNLYKLVKMIA
jgi:Transposase DDE domain.